VCTVYYISVNYCNYFSGLTVGAGRYRKHFILGKDVGDMWAVSMQESIAAVLARVKHIGAAIRSTENFTCKNLKVRTV
jgi:hypothetical protein